MEELAWGEDTEIHGLRIESTEARHWGARMITDTQRGYGGYLLQKAGHTVLFAGDTAYTDALTPLGRRGRIDSVMIVAAITIHWKQGLFATANGIEVPLLYAAGAVTLALTGPGLFSLDALLGLESLWSPGIVWAAIALGVVGGVVNLGLRRSATQHAAA